MKLHEIASEPSDEDIEDAVASIEDYVHNGMMSRDTVYSTTFLMRHDLATYEGQMFRILMFKAKVFVNAPNIQVLSTALHKLNVKRQQQLFSWSKSKQGAETAIWNYMSDSDEHHGSYGVVITQTGTGLDVNRVLQKETAHSAEEELLAGYHNNMKIAGFVEFSEEHGSVNYSTRQYDKFINTIRQRK